MSNKLWPGPMRTVPWSLLIARGFKLKDLQWPETWKGGTVNANLM